MLIEPLVNKYDNTRICITVKRIQEGRACMAGPLTVCLGWVWLSPAQFVLTKLATVLEPKIWLSHCRDRVTFCLQGLNTHIHESIMH